MSDKYAGFVVSFEHEMDEEYMNLLKRTLMSFKGVVSVQPIEADVSTCVGYGMAKAELQKKLISLIRELQ